MSGFENVCPLAELRQLSPRAVRVAGKPVVVVRVGDEVHAVADICSHAEIQLSEGSVDAEGTISCWLHGSRFDLTTGEPLEPPAWEPIDVYQTTLTNTDGVETVAVSLSPRTEKP